MNNISFIQQEDIDYISLKLKLGLIEQEEADEIGELGRIIPIKYLPLEYTARMNRMDGDYTVIKGIRYNYAKVNPEMKVRLSIKYLIDMKTGKLHGWEDGCVNTEDINVDLIAEQCLGIKGVTFEQLKRKLLSMNKNATENSVFYVHKIEKIYSIVQ